MTIDADERNIQKVHLSLFENDQVPDAFYTASVYHT